MAKDPEELRLLDVGWDTYDAQRITEEAIATAKALEFVPSPDGGLQIELHAGLSEIEIEVAPNGRVSTIFWERRDPGDHV